MSVETQVRRAFVAAVVCGVACLAYMAGSWKIAYYGGTGAGTVGMYYLMTMALEGAGS